MKWRKRSSTDQEDEALLTAEPISRKRMDLLWLDPPRLRMIEQGLAEHGAVSVVLGDSTSQREHEITAEDIDFAKGVEQIVDKAHAAGERGDYEEAVRWYTEALRQAPGCDLFLMSIGDGYASLGQVGRGLRFLKRAAEISPGNQRIADNLAQARAMS